MRRTHSLLPVEPLWFKDAVIYQIHVKAFCDSNGDGIGDFAGLASKLDYLQALGVNTLWILPFYPSPLRDDGYDIADYQAVHPAYGSLQDFQIFLREAHSRGIRLITELVLNHTSDQHAWFQRARRAAPGSVHHDFYVWSDNPNRYADARIIFKDFETSNWAWDAVAKRYYWHRFYSHQPDLNFENPKVQHALLRVMDFWLEMGVDGVRLDAVPYLYEEEGTNCENLPATMAFLSQLREHVDTRFPGRMLLAEANQWPEDAAAYFGQGDRCHMNFHFPLMPRMFMALQMEDRFPIIDILEQTPDIPDNCQWAMFLRNHDELTLEMVTDEERDYMYRVYARDPRARINLGIRRRLAPLCGNNRRKIELLNMLLFSMPGTPIVYYGDEIGMGDNIYLGDRNGVRTPMQWSADRNAGFSKANPQRLFLPITIDPEYHYESLNVENAEQNPSSLLWWTRRVIAMRNQHPAFGRGGITFLYPDNAKVLAFVRTHEEEAILVVVNLSRYSQVAWIDLSTYAGSTPVELFSRNAFPIIREEPYVFTLGIHDYFWLKLEPAVTAVDGEQELPVLPAEMTCRNWEAYRTMLEKRVLPAYLPRCRWFGGKARKVRSLRIREAIPAGVDGCEARLWLIEVAYVEGAAETYLLPVTILEEESALRTGQLPSAALIARVGAGQILCDALHVPGFRTWLFQCICGKKRAKSTNGRLVPTTDRVDPAVGEISQVLGVEQSNSAIVYGNRYFLKLYRRLEEGPNPDAELTRFLFKRARFEYVPATWGSLVWQGNEGEARSVALIQAWTPNQGDAWGMMLDVLERYFERILVQQPELPMIGGLGMFDPALPDWAELEAWIGTLHLDRINLLAERTAGMHLALACDGSTSEMAPEPFTALSQRSLYQSMRGQMRRTFQLLHARLSSLAGADQAVATHLLDREPDVLARLDRLRGGKMAAQRMRIHGDYHLGQVLNTGRDFLIIDFEGEPSRPISERRLKRSPLRDVAGMLRSIQYAAGTALRAVPGGPDANLSAWAVLWEKGMAKRFWLTYAAGLDGSGLLPAELEESRFLLEAFLLEKAAYEIVYELNNRPSWIGIPLAGIIALLED